MSIYKIFYLCCRIEVLLSEEILDLQTKARHYLIPPPTIPSENHYSNMLRGDFYQLLEMETNTFGRADFIVRSTLC